MVEILFEALIGQKTEIRCSHWSKAGQTRTQTGGTGDPYLRYIYDKDPLFLRFAFVFDPLLTNESTGFQFLTNKSFEKKFNHEREPEEQRIPILNIVIILHVKSQAL